MATLYDRLFDLHPSPLRISDLWWTVALRGVSAIMLGTLAVLWPGISLLTLASSSRPIVSSMRSFRSS